MFAGLLPVFTLGLAIFGQLAGAAPALEIEKRQSVSVLSSSAISALTIYGQVRPPLPILPSSSPGLTGRSVLQGCILWSDNRVQLRR